MIYSYSRLTLYELCPYQWQRRYIDGIESPDNFFSQFGKFGHSLLEGYYDGVYDEWDLLPEWRERFSESVIVPPPNRTIGAKWYTGGEVYFKDFKPLKGEVISTEGEYNFKVGEIDCTAFIDLILGRHGVEIVDHKFKMRDDVDWRQLYFYSIAFYKQHGFYPADLSINLALLGRVDTKPLDINEVNNTERWIIDTVATIESDTEYKPKKNDKCKYCEFRSECGVNKR